jgi:hypothetical protein
VVPLANVTVDDVVDDGSVFIWEILLRICWFNRPWKTEVKIIIIHYWYFRYFFLVKTLRCNAEINNKVTW